jgi:2,4-dienoyl-CoA reductase-like NADH-dependent reductase (Old Yellow Enzyme family)
MPTCPRLFEPLHIGPLTLKNRIVMAPMTTLFDAEGPRRYEAFLEARAAGGVAMVVVGLQALWPGRAGRTGPSRAGGPPGPGPLAINDNAWVPRLQAIVASIHGGGAHACAQLGVNSPWAPGGPGTPAGPISPSNTLLDEGTCGPDARAFSFVTGGRALSGEELRRIPDEVGRGARRALEAGFDAIQLQAHCGGLISQFLSPLTNRRTDAYGGRLANRARLLVECLTAIRGTASGRVPVLCRINGDDLMPGGMDPAEYRHLVPMLEAAGVDAIDVKPGWYESPRPVHDARVLPGAFAYVSAAIRQVARVPVSANTRITEPALAESIVARGDADYVSLGGALLADPEWSRKAETGRSADIRSCTACMECWHDLAIRRRPILCPENPRLGRESDPPGACPEPD